MWESRPGGGSREKQGLGGGACPTETYFLFPYFWPISRPLILQVTFWLSCLSSQQEDPTATCHLHPPPTLPSFFSWLPDRARDQVLLSHSSQAQEWPFPSPLHVPFFWAPERFLPKRHGEKLSDRRQYLLLALHGRKAAPKECVGRNMDGERQRQTSYTSLPSTLSNYISEQPDDTSQSLPLGKRTFFAHSQRAGEIREQTRT